MQLRVFCIRTDSFAFKTAGNDKSQNIYYHAREGWAENDQFENILGIFSLKKDSNVKSVDTTWIDLVYWLNH